MASTSVNVTRKKHVKEALAAGHTMTLSSPGPFPLMPDGTEYVEGPQDPEPHRWYAKVSVAGGKVVKVVS